MRCRTGDMAKTGAKPRRAVRANRPRNSSSRSRSRASSRPSAGRRRQDPSLPEQLISWLLRVESFGIAIVLVAFLAIASLFGSTSPLDGLIKAIGLHALTAALALAGLGALLWTRRVDILGQHPRVLAALLPLLAFSAGLLALFHPGWQLGANSLSAVSAGGEFGEALVSEPLGVALWLLTGAIVIAIAWPRAAIATLERTPGAVATVWQWRIPQHMASGLAAVLDFAFPTKPPHEA